MARPETAEAAEAHINAIRKAKGVDVEPGFAGSIIDALDKSLSIISEGLYQKSSRFLMEILQNADDCSYDAQTPTMDLTYRNGRLRIDYNEIGFTTHDVEALCTISSTKLKSMNQTGEKGIGFKSVFKMSDKVQVLSGHYSFAFDAKRTLGTITPEWVVNPAKARPGFTSILLQIQGERKQTELIQELKSMGHKHLVFLRRLQQINITIDDNQGKTWETTLNREEKDSAEGRRRIVTSSHDNQTLEYWIYPHIVKTLPPEPKREHHTESVITLAFPVRGEGSPEPVVEKQDIYAVHPIRDYGFKFLVNADFLLVASRQDVDASSKWNETLRTSIWDAFQGAIKHLSVGPLRHTWPRYISIPLNLSGFFWTLGYDMKQRLQEIPIVQTAKGEMVKPLLARYVPPPLRDQDNTPLTLGPSTESRYLSKQYSDSDWKFLQNLQVQMLSDGDFLDDLHRLLSQGNCAAMKPKMWHVQIAKVLRGFSYLYRHKIKELPLIPVDGGRWVSASTGNIFFHNSQEHTALGDLGVSFVDQDATQDDHRKAFFKMLDISELSNLTLQSRILEKHSKTERSLLPAAHLLVSHAVFLFRSGWQSSYYSGTNTPFWVVTTTRDFLPAHQVYFKGEWAYYAHPCFTEFQREFPFLHKDYDSAVKPEETGDWISWLCKQLGVQSVSSMTPALQKLVVEKHSNAGPTDLPAQELIISHAEFLFETGWTSKNPPRAFYVVTEVGAYVQAKDVYLDTSTQQSFGQYFDDFRRRCQFLHKQYYSAVEKDEKKRWLKWLHENIGVQDTSRLVPKLAELTYRECSESNHAQLLTRDVLISHTVFLFRAKWENPKSHRDKFWVFTEGGQRMPAQQVYLDTAEQSSTRGWYKRFRKEFQFLHKDYYHAVKPGEEYSWLTWLSGQLGLWEVPRLVDPSDPATLSSDFRQILDSWLSKEFLMLLKDEWNIYERFFQVNRDQNGTGKVLGYPPSAALRDQVGSAKVKCRDGLTYPLRDTFTIDFLPKGTDAEILTLHPLLEISESRSADWRFLEKFGVTMKESVAMYLKTLDKVRGSTVSLKFISWLYGQIQEKDSKEPGDLTTLSSKESIYIPGTAQGAAGHWVPQSECVWEGGKFLRRFHMLKRIYPECELLFKKILTHKDVDIEVLVSEAEAITANYPLKLITKLFNEIRGHVPRLNESLTNRLRAAKIFPIDEGNTDTRFDTLDAGMDDSEWYIADRPHLLDSFRGVVALLSFSPRDTLRMMPLIKALGLEFRLLSKLTKSNLITEGKFQLHQEHTKMFRAKSKFIARLLPRSMSSRGDILTALDKLNVFVAEKVLLQWTLEPAAGRWTSHVTKGHHYDDGIQAAVLPPKGDNGIQVYLEAGNNSHFPLEFTRRFADICGIEDQANLVYFVFSQNDLAYVEQCLERQGVLAIDDTDDADFDAPEAEIELGMAASWHGEIGKSESKEDSGKNPGKQANGELVEKAKVVVNGTGTSDTQKTPVHHPKTAQRAQTGVAVDSGGANTQAYNLPDMPSTASRPDYSALSSHLDAPSVTGPSSSLPKPASSAKASTSHASFTVLGRPRIIGAPTVVFVPSQEDLPLENFSQSVSGQDILPARAQISHSGSCTVVIATNPDTRSDPDVAFVGELFVSKLLEQHLGQEYNPEKSWTSPLRNRAGYKKFDPSTDPEASFTLKNFPAMTDFLIQASVREAKKWKKSNPVYYIQVYTTVGEQESPFIMSAATLKKARDCMILERSERPTKEVFILARVSDLFKSANACFYIDPWKMYASGQMKVQPEMDSYVTEIQRPEPEIKLSDFEAIKVPEFPYRQKHENSKLPFSRSRPIFGGYASKPQPPYHEMYVYRSLRGRKIRLLELKPGGELDELEGRLDDFALDSTIPSFQALSYAWGYSIKPFVLKIRGRVIGITASLYFALKRLRDPKKPVQIWVDAICIDQSEDKDGGKEKSAQIRLMPDIFKRATKVIVWVGEEMNEDSRVFESFRELISAQAQGSDAATIAENSETWDSINKFFGRPWFQRVWIIQELVFASDVMVMAGKESAPWDDIYAVAKICFKEAQRSTTNVMKQIAQNASVVLRLGEVRLSYHEGEESNQPRLLTLFQEFQYAKATRARDKLFALLGLASDAAEKDLDPDYSETLETIVRKYAKVFVRRGCAIEMLYQAGFSSPRFPSWIPDWITNTPRRTITTWPSKPQGFSACTHIQSQIKFLSRSEVLLAKGHILDTIDEVGKKSFSTCDRIEYLQELSEFVQSRKSYPTGERIEDLVWKIPIGDSIEPTSPDGDRVNFRVAYQAFTEYLQLGEQGKDWKMEIMQARAMAKIKHFLFHPQELRQLLWPYLQTALEFAERFADAKACATEKGYVGIVPGKAMKGDKIVILHGSAVPFLVRESQDRSGYYILLGECYIHGIMHGTDSSTSALSLEDIRIY